MKEINSPEEWQPMADLLKEHGYRIWQMQYDVNHPEGFHVWFAASGRKDVEIVTRNSAVYEKIIRFGK